MNVSSTTRIVLTVRMCDIVGVDYDPLKVPFHLWMWKKRVYSKWYQRMGEVTDWIQDILVDKFCGGSGYLELCGEVVRRYGEYVLCGGVLEAPIQLFHSYTT